ncbi:MAG: SBBP repeat-containing protein [candidate division WOR-3 bacterium]
MRKIFVVAIITIGILIYQVMRGDPFDLLWATYYGGSAEDNCDGQREIGAVCVDIHGNIYITGFTKSTNFPVYNPGTGAYFQASNAGYADLFIVKFSPTGQRLWATYYGGSNDDLGLAITTDNSGNVIVCGITFSSNFPLYNPGGNAYYQGYTSGGDGFIIKFDSLGQRLWATCLGGSLSDAIYAVRAEATGKFYVVGNTYSSNFPVYNPGGSAYYQASNAGSFDGFIAKFSETGERLWATYYGGNDEDHIYGIALDNSGNFFATGMTRSSNFPVYNPGGNTYYQGTLAGYRNAFILKFSSAGQRLWATYYGGNTNDYGRGIAVSNNNEVFVVGNTSSANFPVYNPGGGYYFQGTLAGSDDAFILKFTETGERLWATYYGGTYADFARSVAITNQGTVLLTGNTLSNNFPTYNAGSGYFQGSITGGHEIFILGLTELGQRLWATFYGGSGTDYGMSVATDNLNNIIVTGFTLSGNFPSYNPGGNSYYQGSNAGSYDAYILKFQGAAFSINEPAVSKNYSSVISCNTFINKGLVIKLPSLNYNKVKLQILNPFGKVVFTKEDITSANITITAQELGSINPGVYLITIQTDGRTLGLKKIIKL